MKPKAKLHSNLQALIDERRITIRELATRIDYRFESVRQLCKNELVRIPVELVERVCSELNVDIADLFTVDRN